MRVRHKVPSIFSLSMVDMLCCALGCVILIWLLNAKQSEDEAVERRLETETILAGARADRDASQKLLAAARTEYAQATDRVRTLMGDREKAGERIRSLERAEAALKKQLIGEQEQARLMAADLKGAKGRIDTLQGDVSTATAKFDAERKKSGALDRTIAAREKELVALGADLKEAKRARQMLETTLASRARDLETAALREKTLQKQLDDRRLALDESGKKLAKLEKEKQAALNALALRVLQLEKDKRDALEATAKKLSQAEREKALLRLAADNRFAGITLTGKRVIFLIDMSGSMGYLDDKTKAPHKWAEVAATVAKVMRSLPELEKFQVIVFNASVSFPLGSVGRWIDHDPKLSPEQAERALQRLTPAGGTNMYAALESTFRFRAADLDTVYLLSDGLPNEGEGAAEANRQKLPGVERSDFLGKKVRAALRTEWNKAGPKQPRVKVNTIGFFYESPDLGAFLWALARENDGSFVGMSKP